ncbi:MAG TPA: serine/threonine-protein kinase, partial [Aggregatilineales bacterium]|nr:serine/threonine-protein kinase [Aggregatilineales bacterium]
MDVNITLINERYLIQNPIGKGGMGIVYRATDRLSGQNIALKQVIDPAADSVLSSTSRSIDKRLALAQEFQLLASLRHPHIISVLDYGFDAQRLPYFTMDLLENPVTVTEYCLDLSTDGKLQALVDILQALKYLHRRGILHRDLKPANILVANGQLKVLDFGLAIVHEQHQGDKTSTSGTLAYMAPELLTGNSASESSDLYAVGVVAYELFSGRHPF